MPQLRQRLRSWLDAAVIKGRGSASEYGSHLRSAIKGGYSRAGQVEWNETASDLKAQFLKIYDDVATGATDAGGSIVQRRLRQMHGALGGTAAGVGAGILLGGGGVGIVALGGAIGLPLIAITGLVGLVAGERGGRELDWLRGQWQSARCRLEDGRGRDEAHGATRIEGRQHLYVLRDAFRDAEHIICIRSAFLSDRIVNPRFCGLVSLALDRGIHVYIEFGWRLKWSVAQKSGAYRRAETNLEELRSNLGDDLLGSRLHIGYTPTHLKELVVDDKYVIVGSNNWLSNRDFHNREASYRIRDAKLAAEATSDVIESVNRQPWRAD